MPTCWRSSRKAEKQQHDSEPAGAFASKLAYRQFSLKERHRKLLAFNNLALEVNRCNADSGVLGASLEH